MRSSRPIRTTALFVAGVLAFCDVTGVAIGGLTGAVAMLLVIGFAEARMRAVGWAVVLVASALAADVLWWIGWEPYDRADVYEPLPVTPFVLVTVPVPMALIAIGVGARALWRRRGSRWTTH